MTDTLIPPITQDMPTVEDIALEWATAPRWRGVARTYSAADVVRLRGTVQEEHTLARRGAERLWHLLNTEDYVPALGALTGNQAVQMVKAGLQAIYLSGWQVASDASTTPSCVPTRLPGPRAIWIGTGWCPSWPTLKPALAVRSMPSN